MLCPAGRWARGGALLCVPARPSIAFPCCPWAGWRGTGGGEGIRARGCVELTASMWAAEGASCGPSFTGQGTRRLPPSPPVFICPAAPAPKAAIFPASLLPGSPWSHAAAAGALCPHAAVLLRLGVPATTLQR